MTSVNYLLHFIDEDAPFGDITSSAVIPDITCAAIIKAEQDGIIAGLSEAAALFSHFGVSVKSSADDGNRVRKGDVLLSLNGDAKKILLVERTALNIIGRMSGIATQTKEMVDAVSRINEKCRVAGTRKTSPGCRRLDKKAILLGGGDPHRDSLSDGILIKDNHLVLVSLRHAITSVQKILPYKKIEIEVETMHDALKAAGYGAGIIMLDNMAPDEIRKTTAALSRKGLRDKITIEISGGITGQSLAEYAGLDIDRISMGSLTHSVKNFSVNLEIVPSESE